MANSTGLPRLAPTRSAIATSGDKCTWCRRIFCEPLAEDRGEETIDCAVIKHLRRRCWRERQVDRHGMSLPGADALKISRKLEALLVALLNQGKERVDVVR